MKLRRAGSAALFIAGSTSCSENSGRATSAAPSVEGIADCTAENSLQSASLEDFVNGLAHDYRYTPLSFDAMNSITNATRALDAEDLPAAQVAARGAGYGLSPLVVSSGCYWVLTPPGFHAGAGDAATTRIQQAVLVYSPKWTRNLVIEAPHATEDHNTDLESALLFETQSAKALIVSGSHRCIQGALSSGCRDSAECSHPDSTGISPAIPPSESDPAHSIHNAVYAMHLAFRDTDAVILQLHTNFHPEKNGDAMISNGTHFAIPGTFADRLYEELQAPDLVVGSCNDPAHPRPPGAFCGEINTEGLASNGAADTCLGAPSSKGTAADHRFIHLEQWRFRMCSKSELPNDAGTGQLSCLSGYDAWTARVGDALAKAIPHTL